MVNWFKRLAAVSSVAFLAACGGADGDGPVVTPNIVQTAQSNADFSILVEAVVAAGLAETLSGDTKFTVFAPTNAAFEALLAELGVSKAALLADTALLRTVLTYHVVAGEVKAADVPLGKAIESVQTGIFKVDSVDGELIVTDGRNRTATITATDLIASNGVIHVVNRVILPADKNIVATAQGISDFSILVAAVVEAGLVETLSGEGPFTVFAPTNAAFAALLAERGLTQDELLADEVLLGQVLLYHVVPGRVLKADVPVGVDITTAQGGVFTVDASLAITDANDRVANITATDVLTSNGVIHVVDKVILPAAP